MSFGWYILGVLALALLGAVVELVVRDYLQHSFPSLASWWGGIGGELVRVAMLTVAMVGVAGLCLFMASSETATGHGAFLWALTIVPLLIAASQVYIFRRDPRRTRR